MAMPTAFAIVGLGRIGGGLATAACARGLRVVGLDVAPPAAALREAGVEIVADAAALAAALPRPRVVMLYVPAGPAVDELLDSLAAVLERGDVLVDGGNSWWRDSQRRHARLAARGIGFVDAGTSGGVAGARDGACFMVGGSDADVAVVAPLLGKLAVDGGFAHAGGPGMGHYAKLVHNGIEFGMLEALGEGLDLLERGPDAIDTAAVLECWRHGSVIRSWLVDLLATSYASRDGVADVPGYVEDTGEVSWLVDDALRLEVSIPVIAQSVMRLIASRDGERNWARAIAMMRHGFGGHPFGPDAAIARERRIGRVGGGPGA
ncbi:MAG TPA: NADP-dependent phosphogluconate dehydrogenase [Xanthomonadales bacterium]|nr:NADP-dependent phosphogluconate dehydrogenase [Xanthomonadales bacterium]